MGEPAGIGPEIAVKAFTALGGRCGPRPLRLLGDPNVFAAAAARCGLDGARIRDASDDTGTVPRTAPNHPSTDNAGAVTNAIAAAVRACTAGKAAAVVTAPIHKAVLARAGFAFPGHTEYLAALTGAARAVMMLASHDITPPLRVVPFTVHLPLASIFERLDPRAIAETGEVIIDALAGDFGCAEPRLAVAGLNPHAGEEGVMGGEEARTILPAIEMLRAGGRNILGPLPADTLFHDEARARYDAVLCMYHDQALIPIKTLAFWSGVNVTLGLPIVRTSPDHGTAFDIAGRGIANPASMIAAIRMAADIADRRGL